MGRLVLHSRGTLRDDGGSLLFAAIRPLARRPDKALNMDVV